MVSGPEIIDPNVAGVLGFVLAARALEAMTAKGVITLREGIDIYKKTIADFAKPEEREAAARLIKRCMPDLPL